MYLKNLDRRIIIRDDRKVYDTINIVKFFIFLAIRWINIEIYVFEYTLPDHESIFSYKTIITENGQPILTLL